MASGKDRRRVEISAAQYERMAALAMAQQRTLAQLVGWAVEEWLERQETAPVAPGRQSPAAPATAVAAPATTA